MAGEIVHLELPSRSFERSASFYNKLFGWRTDGTQTGGHLLFEAVRAGGDGAPSPTGGSFVLAALAQAPGPLPFVAVDDVDATLAEAERQGGRILVRRLALAGRGEFGLFADPDGNVMAVLAGGARPTASVGANGAGNAVTSADGGAAEGAAAGTGSGKTSGRAPAEAKAAGGSKAAPKAIARARSGDSSRSTASRPRPAAGKKPSKGGKR